MNMNRRLITAAAAVAGIASAASGGVTVFVNDNPDFTSLHRTAFPGSPYPTLSVMHDAYSQYPVTESETQIFIYDDISTGSSPNGVWLYGSSGTDIAHGEVQKLWVFQWERTDILPGPLLVTSGDQVDSSDFGSLPTNFSHPALWFNSTSFTPDESTYIIALSITLNDGVHYGFVEFDNESFHNPRPIRWGYETLPDTPLVIPAASCGVADFNSDGELDFFDFSSFIAAYTANNPAADINQDGDFDFFDVSAFYAAYILGCP